MEKGGVELILCSWTLSKLAEVYGADAPATIADIIKSKPTISILPTNIIASILNYTDLKDTLNVIMVCQKWHQASRLKHFWRERILEGFGEYATTDQEYELLKTHFDVFLVKEQPFREKLEWLFMKDPVDIYRGDAVKSDYDFLFHVTPRSEPYVLSISINTMTKSYVHRYFLSTRDSSGKWVAAGLDVNYYNNDTKELKLSKKIQPGGEYYIEWVSKQGHLFKGSAMIFNKHIIPHGAGKWTFLDGTTLTGNNVAFDGIPHGVGAADEDEYFAGEKVNRNKKQKI
jgi:hypothetical protein